MKKGTARQIVKETKEQEFIFNWSKLSYGKYPCLEWCLFAVPNGGKRNKFEAFNLKKQGVKSGVSDMTLQVARGGYNGLWIELKVGRRKATDNQNKFLKEMREQGYFAVVCYRASEAISTIIDYLEMDHDECFIISGYNQEGNFVTEKMKLKKDGSPTISKHNYKKIQQ